MKRAWRTAFAPLLTLLWLSSGCGERKPETPQPVPAEGQAAPPVLALMHRPVSAESLGAESCGDCHEALVESYRQSPMAHALGPLHPGEPQVLAALPPVTLPGSGFTYSFYRTPDGAGEGAVLVEAHPGRPGHQLPLPLALAIGAGVHDRAFAARIGESLCFAALEVQTQAGRLVPEPAPGHSIDPHTRFHQPITNECLGCHTQRLPPAGYPLNRQPPADWQPTGIGCAACHGDGEAHGAAQEAELYGELPQRPVLDFAAPSGLTRHQRLSICAACHLQGDARITFDHHQLGLPTPGGDLLETRAVFVAREATEEIGFVSQIERLALSRCFTRSQMVCETCHDPHVDLVAPGERQRVRDACRLCHADEEAKGAHDPGALAAEVKNPVRFGIERAPGCGLPPAEHKAQDCASCHLPQRPTFDVAKVEIHDHWIRTHPGDPPPMARQLRASESPSGDWRMFQWPATPPKPWAEDPGLWMLARQGAQLLDPTRADPADLEAALHAPFGARSAELPNAWHTRASLAERLGDPSLAESAYRQALALDPDFAPAAINLGLLLGNSASPGDPRHLEGLALLDAVLNRHPNFASALQNRAILRSQLGQIETAIDDLERAMALAPSAAVAETLAEYYRSRRDLPRAALLEGQARLLR